tara:strand:- start:198 stop:533 length:336 start_codon:yes stop_codon:yes gene_type:complete
VKKVLVSMSDECHTLFKQYAAMLGKSMSELMYEFTRQEIHQSASTCQATQNLLKANKIKYDKRTNKKCWSAACFVCVKEKPCRVGVYHGSFVPNAFALENLQDPEDVVGSR